MVPTRTLNPVWSPDSKWVAYASRLKSLYHAIFISNVETGETKQVTDGLADSVWPAWDASGKYLWFFASTDFGLKSQWLDMTSYDHDENFGLYLAVLKKGEPSPLLPESDEDQRRRQRTRGRRWPGGRGGRGAREGDQADAGARGPRTPVNVQIDFDGIAAAHPRRAGRRPSSHIRRTARGRRRNGLLSSKRRPRQRRRRTRRRWRRQARCIAIA